ncbi:helix-turn-helix domain-containing protein [Bradyrhizobium sp. STM 3566]|uniref:helix-turn-helix domain-containing protein n=1 Tax=Bradyrhizobium sp. STM 3566 TaxID=578928 RepID=UPI00388EE7C4
MTDPYREKTRQLWGRPSRTKRELVDLLRARKEALNVSHETVDAIVGWSDRLSSKVLAPAPRRGLTGETLQAVLDALGLGIAAVILVEDPEQTAKMQHRWTQRGVTGPRPVVRCLENHCDAEMGSTNTEVA